MQKWISIQYVEQHHDHEEGSAHIGAKVLPGFGYSPARIEVIAGINRATHLPQQPHTLLEQIMADADLDVLGQADYVLRNAVLREELAAFGCAMTDAQWYGSQLQFIRDHCYFTAAARALRGAQKQVNIAALAAVLAQHQ